MTAASFLWKTSQRSFVSVVLLVWYIVAAYLAVASLGIQQFQARDVAADTNGRSITRLLELADDKDQIELEVDQAKVRYKSVIEKLNAAKLREAEISARIQQLQQSFPNEERRNQLTEWHDVQKLASSIDVDIISWETNRDVAKADLGTTLEQLNAARQKLDDKDLVVLEKIKRRSGQERIIKDWAPFLFDMPREFLTLILTLSMGVFGSTIHVSRVFFSAIGPETENRFWYVFRPMQGAFMAFAVYIFFKSGGLMYNSAGGNGTEANLNPFVIAFVGLISGLFSENAYLRLDDAARKLFRTQDTDSGPALYGSGISDEIKRQNKAVGDFSALTGIDRQTLEKWVRGLEAVPSDKQLLFVTWLNTAAESLFSNDPPDISDEMTETDEQRV